MSDFGNEPCGATDRQQFGPGEPSLPSETDIPQQTNRLEFCTGEPSLASETDILQPTDGQQFGLGEPSLREETATLQPTEGQQFGSGEPSLREETDVELPAKIDDGFISEMLRDGILSAEGLASKGFVFVSDESGSEEESDDSSDDGGDEESDDDEVSSIADSEEGARATKTKAKTQRKEDSEETGPPRTKHELDVLPPVSKVTVVLEPHHKTLSVGRISSVLDLTVIVESSGIERVLNENSILWLTESRVPLGIVDEVFGPVKNPFYLVRFNEVSEIPENAKVGADVSYVSEFSEFVLKDNPSLYKRAVDASGLDDEELASDEELEFSDDEKEAAAKMREKSKRALDNRENRQGQDWKSADAQQHSKGPRIERGRGRGRGGWRGATTGNAVDSAADFVAGMDLQGSPWNSPRPGNRQHNGRRWNRGRQNSPRSSSHQEMQAMGTRTGPAEGQMSSSKHQHSPQIREGLYVAEQAGSQMLAQQGNQAGGMQCVPFNVGAMPAHLLRQGVPTAQPNSGFQAFGYQQGPGYDAQLGIPGQGNFYPVPGGPQFVQNPVVFGNPNMPINPYFNSQGQSQMNLMHSQGYSNVVHAGQMNFGVPVHRSLGDAQPMVQSSLPTFMGQAPVFGSGMVLQDNSSPYMLQTSHNQGPVGSSRGSFNGQRGHSSGRQQRNYQKNKGSQR
ncbi:unnamed protein product [Calypogeia fissa]